MDSLVEKIRGAGSPLTIAMEPFALGWDYAQISDGVSRLVRQQTEFKRLMHGESSAFYGIYLSARKYVLEKWMKKRQYSLDELFDIQLNAISSLNSSLQTILHESRGELKQLELYFEQASGEVSRMIEAKGRKKGKEIEDKCRVYSKIRGQLLSARKDGRYFQAFASAKRLKREISEYAHKQSLANEFVANVSMEASLLDATEDLLRISIHTCEKIALKTAVFERYLSNTRRAYEMLRMQQKAVSSLNASVETMSAFTLQMQEMLKQGFESMGSILSSEPFFGSANANIRGMVQQIGSANNLHDESIERMLK